MEGPELITVKETAARLRCSQANILRLCWSGKIQATKEFGRWMINKPALEKKIIKSLNQPKPGEAA